ncbi:MAG: His/Gly/Thr/Pro-type tRNA ligase C-terminal domain-containing protein, partial [Actinomycetota bacterium]
VEANHDESGIAWPAAIAPYEAVVTVVKADDPATLAAADEIYRGLLAAGVDVIIDDRDERPGVKFADAELIGFPYRVTVGPRGLADGEVEVMRRRGRDKSTLPVGEAVAVVAAAITAERTL